MEQLQTIMIVWILPAVNYGRLLSFMSRLFQVRLKLWKFVMMALLFPAFLFPMSLMGIIYSSTTPAGDMAFLISLLLGFGCPSDLFLNEEYLRF